MGRGKIFFLFNIFFILALFGIGYKTFETYLVKKEVSKEIKNTEKEVEEYAEK